MQPGPGLNLVPAVPACFRNPAHRVHNYQLWVRVKEPLLVERSGQSGKNSKYNNANIFNNDQTDDRRKINWKKLEKTMNKGRKIEKRTRRRGARRRTPRRRRRKRRRTFPFLYTQTPDQPPAWLLHSCYRTAAVILQYYCCSSTAVSQCI